MTRIARLLRPVLLLIAAGASSAGPLAAAAARGDSDEARFRDIYRELVETNTSLSAGSCTLAAERMAERLKSAGFPAGGLHPFADPAHPKEGGLVAVYPGRDPKAKAILLLAHLDVVEAKREDWTRDPFELIEENGQFYGRGTSDDKAQAAIWVDTLVRFASTKYQPRRTVKMALTCGEETTGAFNGAAWLSTHERGLIDAEFALNEGAMGELDDAGKPVLLEIQAGEKNSQDFLLEVRNPGGHSSRPVKDNAIYHLAHALTKVEAYEFPAQFTDGNRAYFAGLARIQAARGNSAIAQDMRALVRDPNDQQAIARVSAADPTWNATLRTTCVATLLSGGHASNALPQRASANVNCRIFPGVDPAAVRDKLVELIGDPAVVVTQRQQRGPVAAPPPLTPAIMQPVEKLTARYYPGVPVVPILQPGGTDGIFLAAVGIPTYGIEPVFVGRDLNNIHGLNEHMGVESLLKARAFLFDLVRMYADRS